MCKINGIAHAARPAMPARIVARMQGFIYFGLRSNGVIETWNSCIRSASE